MGIIAGIVLSSVLVVGILAELVFPDRTLWWQFWKEPTKPGQDAGIDEETSEQVYDQDPEAVEEDAVCWPWEWCFWSQPPSNPTGR